jgi:hypothetical protein
MDEIFDTRFNAKVSKRHIRRFKLLAEANTSGNTSVLFRLMVDRLWAAPKRHGLNPPKKEVKECDHLND